MYLSSLTLTNIRQFDRRTFEFQPGFNLLVGENGAGKTTILLGLLAALGGTQQMGRRPKLEDDDIRLHERHAEVRAVVHSSNDLIKDFHFQKRLGERSSSSRRGRDLPLVLLYASNEATCSAMKVKRAKRIRGSKMDDFRRDEEFLYEMEEMESARLKPNVDERRFGNSLSVRDFVGGVLSTFSPDFRHFYWRFEPYDCALLPGEGSGMTSLDKETQKQIRAFAMRFLQENQYSRRNWRHQWPDKSKIVLTTKRTYDEPGAERLPNLDDFWKYLELENIRISPEERRLLRACSLEVKLTPRIIIRRKDGHLSLSQLSDGEQRLFSLFVDIARQLLLRNPGEKFGGGASIVLIDEIDVHLHPKWQRKIVPALEDLFRDCQFIATTHSPFVIQSVDRFKIASLNRGKRIPLDPQNNSIEDIIEDIQGIDVPQRSVRAEKLSQAAEKYFTLLKDADHVPKSEIQAAEVEYRIASEPYTLEPAAHALLKLHAMEAK